MTFQEFLLELMMILMFLTLAGFLDEIVDGMQMPLGSLKLWYIYLQR